MSFKAVQIGLIALTVGACGTILVQHKYDATPAITEYQYVENSAEMGTVLLAVNWNRYWDCGTFENAELRSIGFDLLPRVHVTDDAPPEFVLNGSAGGPDFIVYSVMLKPGEYAISRISIKVAESMSDVGYMNAERSDLFEGDTPLGGTFDISAGEVVYIGHFGMDCSDQPTLWRYYKEDEVAFNEFLDTTNLYIPYLDVSNAKFRLFETEQFGHDFSIDPMGVGIKGK